jgi:hypothetical protein
MDLEGHGEVSDTWESVHTGDVVLGHDGQTYGVVDIQFDDPRGPIVLLYRHGQTVGPAQPPPGTPITVIKRADTTMEAQAFSVLQAAELTPQVIRETMQP